jgi:uncharacterized protein (DUF1684 family)
MKLKLNKNIFKRIIPFVVAILLVVTFSFCDEKKSLSNIEPEYLSDLLKERAQKDSTMQYSLFSPFKRDTTVQFSPLKYFEPNPDLIFKSKLYRDETPDTITIMGFSKTDEEYYSIWFTDRTTGNDTYGVGRYLDFELNDDPEFVYTIDFNRAYNPYCAYTPLFTCPIPREEDFIDLAIEAGEKNFH